MFCAQSDEVELHESTNLVAYRRRYPWKVLKIKGWKVSGAGCTTLRRPNQVVVSGTGSLLNCRIMSSANASIAGYHKMGLGVTLNPKIRA